MQPSKSEILLLALMWMELEAVMLSEISQSDSYLTDIWNLFFFLLYGIKKQDQRGKEGKTKQDETREGDKPKDS